MLTRAELRQRQERGERRASLQQLGAQAEPFELDTRLTGLTTICKYCGASEIAMYRWIKEYDFPAAKIAGVWESDKVLILRWRRAMILQGGIPPEKGEE